MNPVTRYGGIVAGIILIAFGIGSTVTGVTARPEVRDTLKLERITGTPDMDKQIANQPVDTGAKASCSPRACASTRLRRPTARSTARWPAT